MRCEVAGLGGVAGRPATAGRLTVDVREEAPRVTPGFGPGSSRPSHHSQPNAVTTREGRQPGHTPKQDVRDAIALPETPGGPNPGADFLLTEEQESAREGSREERAEREQACGAWDVPGGIRGKRD